VVRVRIKLKKSLITAYNFGAGQEMPTKDIKYQGKPLTRLRELPISRDSCQPGGDGEEKGPSLISWSER
jgi:hypothetical protein